MPETSRWTPMSGQASGRMLGIFREPDPHRGKSPFSCGLVALLLALALSALLVCFVSLALTSTSFPALDWSVDANDLPESTGRPMVNSTTPGERMQDTLTRPVAGDPLTDTYSSTAASQEERSILQEVTTHGRPEHRQVRAYQDHVVRGRILNRNRRPPEHVGATAYSQLPNYTDDYAQLEAYKNPPRAIQEVMSWVEKPGVKFTGVYYKSEDKPYLNGHAYVSDPFVRFKPSHPSEINHLAVEEDRGTRFSNRPDPLVAGSHTQAIFHSTMRPRPLKIMLDIYPMIPEPQPGAYPPDMLDQRGRRPSSPSPGRMIVHLNLYPKKSSRLIRKKPSFVEADTAQERIFEEAEHTDEEESTKTTTEDFDMVYESTTEQTELRSTKSKNEHKF